MLVAVPSTESPEIAIVYFFTDSKSSFKAHLPEQFEVGGLSTNNHVIDHLKFSNDGNQLIASSQQGTIVRIVDATTNSLVKEVCRGRSVAQISSLTLDKSSQPNLLAAASDRRTIHLFKIPHVEKATEDVATAKSN